MLNELKKKLKRAINLDHHQVMKKALDDQILQSQIIDLNTNEQLYEKGVDAFGRSLGEYSTATIYGTSRFAGKIEKGQRYDHVTLNDTGAFYRSFRIDNRKDGFVIKSNSIKDGQDLADIFGPIVGLTKESRSELAQEMAPRMRELALQKIFTGRI